MRRYEIKTDIDLGAAEDGMGEYLLKNVDDILHIGGRTNRELLDTTGEDWTATVIEAEPSEVEKWAAQFTKLTEHMASAQTAIEKAADEFKRVVDAVREKANAEYAAYLPVHEEIERRRERTEEVRRKDHETREKAITQAEEARLAAEDAEKGPRIFYVTTPRQRGQEGPEMNRPTVHHVDCGIAKRLKVLPDPVRIEDAFTALMDGGYQARKRSYRWEDDTFADLIPGVACERCPAFEMLKALAPDTFMDWLERTEKATQKPMPADTYTGNQALYKLLGVTTPGGSYYRRSGYTRVNGDTYRQRGWITRDEVLIGWYEFDEDTKKGQLTSWRKDKLDRMVARLPELGLVGREVIEKFQDKEQVSKSVIAVRRMNLWESRQHREKK